MKPKVNPVNTKNKIEKTYNVLFMKWEESERGWGVRPDGISLHMTLENWDAYLKSHWQLYKKLYGDRVPDEYDRPALERPRPIEVSAKVYRQIKGNGIRFNQSDIPSELKSRV